VSRSLRIFAIALALFLTAAGAGVLTASRWGPERTRAVLEMALSDALDTPVHVREADVYFGAGILSLARGVLVDAEGVTARAGSDGEPALRVQRMQAHLDPISLLAGRIRVRSLSLDGLRASVGGGAGAAAAGEGAAGGLPAALDLPGVPADAEPVLAWLEALARLADRSLAAPVPGGRLVLERSRLDVHVPALGPDAEPWVLALRDVSGTLRLAEPGRRAAVRLDGRLDDGGAGAGLRIDLERDARGALAAELSVTGLRLGVIEPVVSAAHPAAVISGSADLRITATRPQADVWTLALRASADPLEGTVPRLGDGHPVPFAVPGAGLDLDAEVDPERVRVRQIVTARGSRIAIESEVARPLGADSRTVASVDLDHYDVARREALLSLLPPRQIERLRLTLEPVRDGRIRDVHVAGTASLREWGRAFDGERRALLPESVEARARFEGFALRAGDEGESFTELSGRATWRGDRLALRGVRGKRAGRWMPVLDATVDGLSNLAGNRGLPEIPDRADAPVMLGLGPLYDIVVDPERPPGEMPGELMLSLDKVVHPALVWPLRNLFGRAQPGEEGIRVLVEHAVWGRIPVRVEGLWRMQPDGERRVERVALRMAAGPSLPDLPLLDVDDPVWVRGRWHLDAHDLGNWHVRKSTGSFHAVGENVRLASYDLLLDEQSGRALGEGTVDFSRPDELPYWTTVRVEGATAPGIVTKIGWDDDEATGDVAMDGEFTGELRPGRKVLAGMEGVLRFQARDGAIRKPLPALLAVAKATDTFNPFGSRDEIRYSELDAELEFDRGMLHTDELRITGRDLRLLASGDVSLLHPDHPVEAVVGIFFFKAIDRVIGVVPVLNDLLLGTDDSLIGAYVELTGAWAEPDARLVPLKTVASGPASFAMEGVPRFVRRAIDAIESAFRDEGADVSAPPPVGEDS